MGQEVPGGQSKGFKALPDNVYDCQQTVLKVGGGAELQRPPRPAPPQGLFVEKKVLYRRSEATTAKPSQVWVSTALPQACVEVEVDLWSSSDKDPQSGMVELWPLVALEGGREGRERILHFQDY